MLRGREPAAGLWSIPGGKVEPGESREAAVAREVLEETGLVVEVIAPVGVVERPTADGGTFEIHDYTARLVSDPDAAVAADDADAVGWFTPADVRGLECVPGLVAALEEWGVLER